MRYLLDTHILLWWLSKDQGYLQPSLFELFADPQHPITDQLLKSIIHHCLATN